MKTEEIVILCNRIVEEYQALEHKIERLEKGKKKHNGLPDPGDETVLPLDGPGGFLWKASDHSPHNLVVLTPEKFDFESVVVERRDGTKEELRFTGRSNGNRETWRGISKPRQYKNNSLVVAEDEMGERTIWKIGRARKRND